MSGITDKTGKVKEAENRLFFYGIAQVVTSNFLEKIGAESYVLECFVR